MPLSCLSVTLDLPLETVLARVARLVTARPAILESGPGFGAHGRWTIAGLDPRARFEASAGGWSIVELGGLITETGTSDPLQALEGWLQQLRLDVHGDLPPAENEPPFRGGLIGYLGYDIAPWIERLPRRHAPDTAFPDIDLALYDLAVLHDHLSGETHLWAFDLLGEGHAALARRLDHGQRLLEQTVEPGFPARLDGPIRSSFTREDYGQAVCRALEYIRAGDIFQVNLSQRFTARGRFDPARLYGRLRLVSPAPFSAYLASPSRAVVSASPEWFYQTRGREIVTRPIKGTRPRGSTPDQDAALARELQASAKDRAELTMIVDLERNDLGRVCRYGTVRVDEPLTIESYAQVHHLVATVAGVLRDDATPIDVVRAMMPGGSITGAPKIRAMEIIDELEPNRRGVYTGAIGYYTHGASAFNIAIRTLLVEDDRATYQVGGGIVADSDPDAEYLETLDKGRGLRTVLEELRAS
jgi:para-aminobenzoate synthetase component 1